MNIQVVPPTKMNSFIADMAEAYQLAYEYRFGEITSNCISERTVKYVLSKCRCLSFEVVEKEKRLGGIILSLVHNGKRARIFLMFTQPELQNRGVATFLWNELREFMPGVKTWTAGAPYFAVPAIHFLVNKCYFKIIQFTNSVNSPGDYEKNEVTDPWTDGYLYFEKRVSKVVPAHSSKPAPRNPIGAPRH